MHMFSLVRESLVYIRLFEVPKLHCVKCVDSQSHFSYFEVIAWFSKGAILIVIIVVIIIIIIMHVILLLSVSLLAVPFCRKLNVGIHMQLQRY